jgi:NADH-quinone oxidoreductase subunit I
MSMKNAVRDVFGGFWSLLVGLRITLGQFFKPIITVQYPRQTVKIPARFRGHIKLILDPESGLSRCTACNLCARACPSDCIVVEGAKKEGQKTKWVTDYHLDFTTCSLCGLCIEACPFDAIEFSKEYNTVARSRDDFNNMDLVARLAQEREVWAQNRPSQPPTPPASAPVTAVVAAAPAASAAPAAQPQPLEQKLTP